MSTVQEISEKLIEIAERLSRLDRDSLREVLRLVLSRDGVNVDFTRFEKSVVDPEVEYPVLLFCHLAGKVIYNRRGEADVASRLLHAYMLVRYSYAVVKSVLEDIITILAKQGVCPGATTLLERYALMLRGMEGILALLREEIEAAKLAGEIAQRELQNVDSTQTLYA